MSTSLLDLPSELLDRIVELALIHKAIPLNRPPVFSPDRISWARDPSECLSWRHGPSNVKYSKSQELQHRIWRSGPLSLLLVNRRLAEITKLRLERVPSPTPHILDVMLVNETELWPTWICVPPPFYPITDLIVIIRITGTSPTMEGRRYRFSPSDGLPPPITCVFFYLLEHLLESGPLAEHGDPRTLNCPQTPKFKINRLHLNFISPMERDILAPSQMSIKTWLKQNNEGHDFLRRWPYNTVETLLIRPEWLADFVMSNLDYLLGPAAPIFLESHVELLRTHVGSIRAFVDGKLIKDAGLISVRPRS